MRNPTYEDALTRQGLTWTYVEKIALEDIDWLKGLRNQARLLEPIDDDLVDLYAQRKQAGIEFPPLVLWRPGPRSKHVPIDGNQRGKAYLKVNVKHSDAYVVESTDPMVIDRVTWSFNNWVNGKRLTYEECLEHAVAFVQKYDCALKDAAREWHVGLSALENRIKAARLKEALARQSVSINSQLTDDKLRRLQPLLAMGEDVLALAAKAVMANGLTSEDIDDLHRKVRAAKTHDDKIQAVTTFATSEIAKVRKAETKGGTSPRPVHSRLPRERLTSLLRQTLTLMENYPEKASIRPVGPDFKVTREVALDLVQRLTSLFGLGALPREEVG